MNRCVLFLLLISISLSFAGPKRDYRKALELNTIFAYEVFIIKHPDNERIQDINKRLDTLYYKKAKNTNTIESYNEYLRKFPSGCIFKNEALYNIESLEFSKSVQRHSLDSYNSYLIKYPNGKYVYKAKRNIETIVFRNCQLDNSIKSFNTYLQKYPNGLFKYKALTEIERLHFENAKFENTEDAFSKYLSLYPTGVFKKEVLSAIEKLHYDEAIKNNTHQIYLQKYPNGLFSKKIKDLLMIKKDPIGYLKKNKVNLSDSTKRDSILSKISLAGNSTLNKIANYYRANTPLYKPAPQWGKKAPSETINDYIWYWLIFDHVQNDPKKAPLLKAILLPELSLLKKSITRGIKAGFGYQKNYHSEMIIEEYSLRTLAKTTKDSKILELYLDVITLPPFMPFDSEVRYLIDAIPHFGEFSVGAVDSLLDKYPKHHKKWELCYAIAKTSDIVSAAKVLIKHGSYNPISEMSFHRDYDQVLSMLLKQFHLSESSTEKAHIMVLLWEGRYEISRLGVFKNVGNRNEIEDVIKRKDEKDLPDLVYTLYLTRDIYTAKSYLNTDFSILSQAARVWAYRNGYKVVWE